MAAETQNTMESAFEKQNIFFTRDYRHLPKPRFSMWLFVMAFAVPVFILILLFYPQITYAISGWVSRVITNGTGVPTSVISEEFIPTIGPVYLVKMDGSLPTHTFSILNLVVSIILLVITISYKKRGYRSLLIYLSIALCIHIASSIYFVFFPEYFPYTLVNYSELYIEQQVAIWLCIAGISGFAISLIFSSFIAKLVAFVTTMVYSGIYGIARYVIYLLVLHYFSSIYMATLFFTLGMLFDFLQMVFVYILYVQYASKNFGTQKRGTLWKWA